MSKLTIEEVQAPRIEMEDKLFQAIYDFEKNTGFQVSGVNVEHLNCVTVGGDKVNCIQSLTTDIRL